MKIFADWGTSNLRAWLVNDAGEVVNRHASDQGLLNAAQSGFTSVFSGVVEQLGAASDTPALLFGMVGSQKGWLEVPYTPTPADAAGIARSAQKVPAREKTWIIGGVSDQFDGHRPEVMRGEEVQTLGVLGLHPEAEWVCLPGTHTKWVQTSGASIIGFSTFMTGELFQWVTRQSIISTQISGDTFDQAGFLAGLDLAQEHGAFTNALFQLRTRYLAGSIGSHQVRSAASGLLIGHELSASRVPVGSPVMICGSSAMAGLYQTALERKGLDCVILDPEVCAITGLFNLMRMIDDGE